MNIIQNSLSQIERAIIPYLGQPVEKIIEVSGLDKTSVLRALSFLEGKGFIKTKNSETSIIELGVNGVYYKKNHLPERQLLTVINEKQNSSLDTLRNAIKLSDNEFKAALGALKRKKAIDLKDGRVLLIAKKEEISKKFPEEIFIESLPKKINELNSSEKEIYLQLKSRKDIVDTNIQKSLEYTITESGKKIAGKKIDADLIEEVTPEIIKEFPKNKEFRRYNLQSKAAEIYGGKKHFVNQSIEYAKKIWMDMGFKEMTGNLVQTSFWNFDALFTPQDHPAREMQDTFFLKNVTGKLPETKVVEKVKNMHETGLAKDMGWKSTWTEDEAKKAVLRTHTTCLSAHTLARMSAQKETIARGAKFFSIGKNFRNETVDWNHGFEFNQTDGIVIGKNLTFRHLLGYLKEFFRKMGYKQIRFRPSYFPYTEPSVEIEVWHPERNCWLELGGAGMFRPEVVIPLLGENAQVLAWGPGFDRVIMEYNEIKDLRDMYKNDIDTLRHKKVWLK
jgi:phenylalanyl-tRNA synthetase alpha chain